jgi:TusA-related sulfurtransferase
MSDLADNVNMLSDQWLDLRGLRCPLPAIRARQYLLKNNSIKNLTIVVTDATAVHDIPLALQDLFWIVTSTEENATPALTLWTLRLAAHHRGCEPA